MRGGIEVIKEADKVSHGERKPRTEPAQTSPVHQILEQRGGDSYDSEA